MFLKIGHRGACGYEPENTLASFSRALELGVDMVEFDVHICRSGEPVVIHDSRLERTTSGKGYVADKSLDELRSLDAGNGERIPLLTEVLDLVQHSADVNIELKGPGAAGPVDRIIRSCISSREWSTENFLVSSFDHYELRAFSELNPGINLGALITGIPIGYAEFARNLGAYSVNLSREFINSDFISDAHESGLKVLVYTVNEPDEIKLFRDMGVDGIFSNFPDRL